MENVYIVLSAGEALCVKKTLTDAEEFVLACAEDEAYYNYLRFIHYCDGKEKEFWKNWKEYMNDYNLWEYKDFTFTTLYGFMLNTINSMMEIIELPIT